MTVSSGQSWMTRNRKWFIPTVAIGGVAIIVGCILAFIAGIMWMLKSSWAYEEGLLAARQNAAVVEALGEPVKAGLFVSGNINISGTSGEASLAIPIKGPKGEGVIYVEARRAAGVWAFRTLRVEVGETGERIDLLAQE